MEAEAAALEEKEGKKPQKTTGYPRMPERKVEEKPKAVAVAEVKAEVKKEEQPVEKEAVKKVVKKKETTLEDVDAKLKSIIDNPDINF
jgi:predicted AlkP superfamily phosphohydrolase/phosphomutase